MKVRPQIIVVAGPTASGKSDFAVELALKKNGEIISADSRQIYKDLNIGTGKITKKEMKGIPHYMIDVCDINQSFSVAEFKHRALPIINDILARGTTPIICGGTGQYIDALIFTTSIPKIKPNETLRKKLEKKTVEELYAELEKKDTRRAKEIDRHNKVRIIRALEIIASLGKVPTQKKGRLRYPTMMYLMNPTKEVLEKRVHTRLLKRFEEGMVMEMHSLIKKGYDIETLAKRGIEYRYMALHIQGELSYDELIQKLKIATWQYAKRQRTWNKKYFTILKKNLVVIEN